MRSDAGSSASEGRGISDEKWLAANPQSARVAKVARRRSIKHEIASRPPVVQQAGQRTEQHLQRLRTDHDRSRYCGQARRTSAENWNTTRFLLLAIEPTGNAQQQPKDRHADHERQLLYDTPQLAEIASILNWDSTLVRR
jgi:hypothetical protein